MKRPKLIPEHKALIQGWLLTLAIAQSSTYIGQCYAIGVKSYLLYTGVGVLRNIIVGLITVNFLLAWIKITLDYVKGRG